MASITQSLRSVLDYWVPEGLLGDEQELKIAAYVFVGSKASWVISHPGVRDETISALSEFIALLRDKNK